MAHNPLTTLQVLGIRYWSDRPAADSETPLDVYTNSNIYAAIGVPTTYHEPVLPDDQHSDDRVRNLGYLNGHIATSVAAAGRQQQPVLMVGGNCTHMTGVLGGLQDVHGPAARIGLVWFDAHGDFNTPHTTLSGMLGGMPVAVCAGLAYPQWRELSHIAAPLPTERILMVDVRNLDPAEADLIRATDITVAAPAPGFPGADLQAAVTALAAHCDLLYLHIDSDILDGALVPNHMTREPAGPNMAQVQTAVEVVMQTGKVAALALVSVSAAGEGADISLNSAGQLLRHSLAAWAKHGAA